MAQISLIGMDFQAYHGCFKEEQMTGNKFEVDLFIEIDTSEANKTDDLTKTIDYQTVYGFVKKEMMINSALLEHVAQRILSSLQTEFKQIDFAEVTVSKLNPALGGQIQRVSVSLNTDEL